MLKAVGDPNEGPNGIFEVDEVAKVLEGES